jgi:gamma-glutamylcyclotransferase
MRYAAYGSNLHPLRLSERISSAKLIGTSFLPDWSLRFHKRSLDKSGKCNIVSGSSGIHIAIYDISIADKTTLDKIEGLGSGYVEISLAVPDIGECKAYAAEDSYIDNTLDPYDWYKELVLIGARAHNFPVEYIDKIDAVIACPDLDSRRSADRWITVEKVRVGT